MSFALLHDLRDLNVLVLHPKDTEGVFLTDHLRRIGCDAQLVWPIPDHLPAHTDIVFLSMDDEARQEITAFIKTLPNPAPTILAIVGYENPSMLQVVLESGALAVVERPIKPFGLLTNLAIARQLWLERRQLSKDVRKYKRKVHGDQHLARAKAILMANLGTSEDEAYRELRQEAMAKRISIDEVARAVIASEKGLRS
ncbi:ANTAR domain-containing response regulator [Rhodospirillum sp. A1_3_36]|uniref:ANTAR domain-containing response regulator n=1 Tax=Rhodospirillum sp. A1_3_36 TaxID=3391666 RepID=UPI0039A62EE2